jgi:hypothetical protein
MKASDYEVKLNLKSNEKETRKFDKVMTDIDKINSNNNIESIDLLRESPSNKDLKTDINNNVKCYLRIKPDSNQYSNSLLDNKKPNESFFILNKFKKDHKNELESVKNIKVFNSAYNTNIPFNFNNKSSSKSKSKSKSKFKKYNSKSNLISLKLKNLKNVNAFNNQLAMSTNNNLNLSNKKDNNENSQNNNYFSDENVNNINLLHLNINKKPSFLNEYEEIGEYCIDKNKLIFKGCTYTFSHIFSNNSTQKSVFQTAAIPVLDNFIDFFKPGLLFAYGISNSGKTHTIIGKPDDIGILPNSLYYIFEKLKKLKQAENKAEIYENLYLYCSFVEVYNEEIFDLFTDINNNDLDDKSKKLDKIDIVEINKRFQLQGKFF